MTLKRTVADYGTFLVAALMLLSVCGCQRLPPNKATYPVHGKVTMPDGGGPPKGTYVYFIPTTDDGMLGNGSVGEDGTYRVYVYRGQEGLPAGDYKVRIGEYEPEGTPSGFQGEFAKIPEKYRKPDTSGLTLTVKSGDNTFDIAMQ